MANRSVSRIGGGGAAAALLLVGGCMVGPDTRTPEVTLPGAWTSELAGGEVGGAATLEGWWRLLDDPALNELVDRAIKGNLDLAEARGRLAEARAQRGVTAADLFPQVDVEGSYSRSRTSENDNFGGFGHGAPGFGQGEARNQWRAGFDMSWEIDVFGGQRRAVQAAEAGIEAAREDLRDVLVILLAEVARNYTELRGLQERLEIARSNTVTQREAVGLAEARFNAGLTSELDAARARALLATTQAEIPTIEAGIRQAAHRLGVLLGEYPGALVAETSEPQAIPRSTVVVPVGLPSDLLRRRADIRRAERRLQAATANIGTATADLFPRFSLTGTFGFSSAEIGDLVEGDSRFWSIGPAVRWPIFDAGRIVSNIRVQESREVQQEAVYKQTVLTALEEVENSLVNYAREQVREASLAEAVANNRRAVDLANELYGRGLEDFSAVIDAQRELFTVQDRYAQSRTRVTTNLIALYKALGGGWEGSVDPAPDRSAESAVAARDPGPGGSSAPGRPADPMGGMAE